MTMAALPFAPPLLLLLLAVLASAALSSAIPNSVEQAFLAVPTAEGAADHLKYITAEPHLAGKPGDFHMAAYVRDQFLSFGLEARIEPVDSLLNYPASPPYVAMLESDGTEVELDIAERPLSEDATSDIWDRNHTFHGYSPSGDVTAEVVYANFGRPEDFDELAGLGVVLEGKIALIRYGRCFRGLKVLNAQRRGAVGVIIYSDPNEDGAVQGEVYPAGPWRPAHGVQRGSVQAISLCGGDPSRSAGPQTTEATCGYRQEELMPQIPSLPMGYAPAAELLRRLTGPAPVAWRGGIAEVPYAVGPSTFRARLRVNNSFVTTPIPNVIGRVRGEEDRSVILGNHRDAWVFGAADPNSGTAAMLELARGLGSLISRGWRPRRSIIFASWSGEEYGLVGSTAWAENNEDIVDKAYAYLNVDTAVSGSLLGAGGTFALRDAFADVLEVVNGFGGRPIAQDWSGSWGVLGSGSDYTVFLDHLGVASVDFSFSSADKDGVSTSYGQYHSIYDSFDWMRRFGGGAPNRAFEIMRNTAQVWGLLALRLANSARVPFNHTRQAEAMGQWADALPHGVDFVTLRRSIEEYAAAAAAVRAEAGGAPGLNDRLAFTERRFLADAGLPQRKWFRHTLQAPGIALGYGATSFPGIAEALDAGDAKVAEAQVLAAAGCVRRAAAFLRGDHLRSETTLVV